MPFISVAPVMSECLFGSTRVQYLIGTELDQLEISRTWGGHDYILCTADLNEITAAQP